MVAPFYFMIIQLLSELATEFENLAKKKNCYFLAAENYAVASEVDCEHMTAAEHKKLATVIEL